MYLRHDNGPGRFRLACRAPQSYRPRVTQFAFDLAQPSAEELIERYRHLTGTVMPAMAKSRGTLWPVRNDHCFQRIILDTICGGVWYDHVARPAYRHLTLEQARRAVQLCEDVLSGAADLAALNRQSLAWRGKL